MAHAAEALAFCLQIITEEAKSSGSDTYWLGLGEAKQRAGIPGGEQLLLRKSGWASKHSSLTSICMLLHFS